MCKFKTGDRVEVIENSGMNVKIGHQATVRSPGNDYINLIWDREGLNKYDEPFSQMDGDYYPESFKKVNLDWDKQCTKQS